MKIATDRMPAEKVAELYRWLIDCGDAVTVSNIDGDRMGRSNFQAVLNLADTVREMRDRTLPLNVIIEGPDDIILWLKIKFL